ncbi:MAG: ferritin family protein [Planctomycetes bacterium]|nr:ferritin family protein [Planctomycetota bacterium]
MDVTAFSLEELLLAGIRSEIDAHRVYSAVAARVENFLLRDRLLFLAAEEEKHAAILTQIHQGKFPGRAATPPDASPVPLPELDIPDDATPLSTVLGQAMAAEQAARDFYQALADRVRADTDTARMLDYLARMERRDYQLLEEERETALAAEEAGGAWPMIHAGQ